MSDNSKIAVPNPEGAVSDEAGVARRRLVRAGLAVAPVMLALKSNSALAADICIKPSAFSSLRSANYALSKGRTPSTYTCFSHGYWKNHAHPAPYTTEAKSFFLSPAPSGTGNVTAGFTRNVSGFYTGKTLHDVLWSGGDSNDEALARHCVGSFLTAVANNDVNVILTQAECRYIWNNSGVWSPPGSGVTWTKAQTMAYFNYVYGGIQTP